ncbi:MAG: hypothetical protein BZ136_05330 [Methanosphaera sp. rholeuAM74]|nr:MAG: hypothetical protein BZ136_05330 [Methanosphaera sp. rholeuAM74]
MKLKNLLLIPLLVIVVVALSGCITDSFEGGELYEKNGITFRYPDTWQEASSVAEGSVAAVAHRNNSAISIVIQQVPSELGNTTETAYENNNRNLEASPGYINIQENTTQLNGKSAKLHRYITNENDGSQKEHIATWLTMSDHKMYVVFFSSPVENYENEKYAYDKVVGSFDLINNNQKQSTVDKIFDLFK